MKFSDNVYFTVDTIDNHFNLSPYFVNTYQQFLQLFMPLMYVKMKNL